MELWVGPAIIAALVSALVSAAGWFVSSWQVQRLEAHRRAEKVHDYQVALRAEIASDLFNLQTSNRNEIRREVEEAFRADPNYQPFVPHVARNVVFEQIVTEIHVLPGDVISSVIAYARLRQSLEHFIEDLRGAIANKLPPTRLALMMADYLEILDRLEKLAIAAVTQLDRSLMINKPGVGPSPAAASEQASHRSALP